MLFELDTDDRVGLSRGQEEALAHIGSGNNLFLTGPGGTGKSFLIHRLSEICKKNDIVLAITAFTGSAASQLYGQTMHSWFGCGLAADSVDRLITRVLRSREIVARLTTAQVFVGDEISMASYDFLDKMDQVLRAVRKCNKPFGGLVMVLCGDFCQLPPVGEYEERLFETRDFIDWVPHVSYLRTSFRQTEPGHFKALCRLRLGDASDIKLLMMSQLYSPDYDPGAGYTMLYSTRRQVAERNTKYLKKILEESKVPVWNGGVVCKMTRKDGKSITDANMRRYRERVKQFPDAGHAIKETAKYVKLLNVKRDDPGFLFGLDHMLKNSSNELGILTCAAGARIMLRINFCQEMGLFNGAAGKVLGFCDTNSFPLTFDEMLVKKAGSRREVVAELSKVPEYSDSGKFNPVVEMEDSGLTFVLPRSLYYDKGTVGLPTGTKRKASSLAAGAKRARVTMTKIGPLFTYYSACLAFALTIHKSQGMTLDHVAVSTRGIFAKGQTYVAFSRIRNLKNLVLLGSPEDVEDVFSPHRQHCDPLVRKFYEALDEVTDASVCSVLPLRSVFDKMREKSTS